MDASEPSPGGISGRVGPASRRHRQRRNRRFTKEGDAFHITTGPAISYWNPANTAKGDYTVKATFTEPQYMNLNRHDHPYGIVIAGNDMGTDQQSYLYCAAYGDGRFIVRGFGPAAFKMNGPGEANAAIHKAAAKGDKVTQEIAMSVKGDQVTCSINARSSASYPKADLGPRKAQVTDGVYGIRSRAQYGRDGHSVFDGFNKALAFSQASSSQLTRG
jgi:hypothetical protein